jgi:hypothetical protein
MWHLLLTISEARVSYTRINWAELLLLGVAGLLTLGLLAFFIILFVRNREKDSE